MNSCIPYAQKHAAKEGIDYQKGVVRRLVIGSITSIAGKIAIMLAFFLFAGAVYLVAQSGGGYVASQAGLLSAVSGLFFIALFVLSAISSRLYFFVLPLTVLSVPNAINDLLPSVLMGSVDSEIDPPAFALVTHIDLFLLFGLIRYANFVLSRRLLYFFTVSAFIACVVFFNYAFGSWRLDGLYGLYQLRYLLLVYMLFSQIDSKGVRTAFLIGLIGACALTLIESTVFSIFAAPVGYLHSGNLGKNPLGHFGAASLCFLLYLRGRYSGAFYKYIPILFSAILMFASETRFSVVSAAATIYLMYLLRPSVRLRNLFFALFGLLIMLLFTFSVPQGRSMMAGLTHLVENITALELIERTPESSSMVTRLHIWVNTIKEIDEYWAFGIGPGNWSFMKSFFDIPYGALLDPHNDLVNFVVSYGVAIGLFLYAILIFLPLLVRRQQAFNDQSGFLLGCYAFLLCLGFTGLTNSTLWKHQIFALACVVGGFLMFSKKAA